MIVILGAGIAGLAAYHRCRVRGLPVEIYERDESWGGLCAGFAIDGFWFDKAIHLSFATGPGRAFFDQTECITHIPNPHNYYRGHWLKHPAQNNLYPLPPDAKADLIAGFVEKSGARAEPENYEQWLRAQYGDCFAEQFPLPYTRKYWRCEAAELSVSWVADRMYRPNLREVLLGAFSAETPVTYYAKEMRYPTAGKYQTFLLPLIQGAEIHVNHEATELDLKQRCVRFSNGRKADFRTLVSSLPLPELVRITRSVPAEIVQAVNQLEWTSVQLVSLGFSRHDHPPHLWDYYYDEGFYPARSYSPSLKSPRNVPDGCSSLQFEVYTNPKREAPLTSDAVTENILNFGKQHSLFEQNKLRVVDVRILKYGNVVFLHGMEAARDQVREFYRSHGVETIGRFGEWAYFWSDQSFLSGQAAADRIP